MLVLGVTDGITCGAALAQDGAIVAAVNEERLCRKKMAYGFPRESIAEVMRIAGVGPSDIDLVAADTVNNFFSDEVREFSGWFQQDRGLVRNSIFALAGRLSPIAGVFPGAEQLYYLARGPIFRRRRAAIARILRQEFGITAPVEFVDHHLAHAASAYFTSGFDEATVVTMDGGGDGLCSRVFVVRDGVFEELGRTRAFDSPANFYAYVTHLCGYKAQKHEGKITGLAAHGEPKYLGVLDSMVTISEGRITNRSGRVFRGAVDALARRLPEGWRKADLAASIQQHCERIATEHVQHYLSQPGMPGNLCLAGGLFANVRINQKLQELPEVRRLWVHPGMTDVGLAVGAALAACICGRSGPSMPWLREVIRDVYYGPGYSAREIETELRAGGLKFQRPASIEAEVARLLAEGYVVARFDGRMEYGPRALGNRSILYQPADRSVNDWLNERLNRTEFMPFAPATLIEYADQHYRDWEKAADSARFMTVTYDCTDWMRRTCPGVVHLDGTARPQLVARKDNLSYWRIIDEFRKLTGVASVINTSFNMHEEPIVCSPGDAVRSFRTGHLDYLAIGEFLVPSPEPLSRELVPMRVSEKDAARDTRGSALTQGS